MNERKINQLIIAICDWIVMAGCLMAAVGMIVLVFRPFCGLILLASGVLAAGIAESIQKDIVSVFKPHE